MLLLYKTNTMFNFSGISAIQMATSNIIRQQEEKRRLEEEERNKKRLLDLQNKKKGEIKKYDENHNHSKIKQDVQQNIYSEMEKLAIDLIRDSDTFILLGIKEGKVRVNNSNHISKKYIEDTILSIAEQIKNSRLNNN